MSHYFYITPDEYQLAMEIGISPALLEVRIRLLGWKKEKALQTPVRKLTDRKYWADIAKQNGIKYESFFSRLTRGWDMERAATKPLQTPEERREQALYATEFVRKIPRKYIELAASNGIAHATLHDRLKRGLDIEQAATLPITSHSEAGRLGARALRDQEGDWAALIFKKKAT